MSLNSANIYEFWSMCPHQNYSSPDEMGDAICADCGRVIRVALTLPAMLEFKRTIERNYGSYSHSKKCVQYGRHSWVCDKDCPAWDNQ